ncbi:hypothetical protein D3C71_1700910 [compost metagenome]
MRHRGGAVPLLVLCCVGHAIHLVDVIPLHSATSRTRTASDDLIAQVFFKVHVIGHTVHVILKELHDKVLVCFWGRLYHTTVFTPQVL